jgi:hypothetical protein
MHDIHMAVTVSGVPVGHRICNRTDIHSISVGIAQADNHGDEIVTDQNGSCAQRTFFPLDNVPHRFRSF